MYKLHSHEMGCDTIQLVVKNDDNKTTLNDNSFYNGHLRAGSCPGVAITKNRAKPRGHDYSYATQVWY